MRGLDLGAGADRGLGRSKIGEKTSLGITQRGESALPLRDVVNDRSNGGLIVWPFKLGRR
jgi:hypothetical protein